MPEPLDTGAADTNAAVLHPLAASLAADHSRGIVYELALEHDAVNKALDGAEDTLIGIAMGVGALIDDPIRALTDLAQLPSAIAHLLANSPELWERFRAMPGGDQVQVVSQLVTTLLSLHAAGSSATGAIARAGTGGVSGTLRVSPRRASSTCGGTWRSPTSPPAPAHLAGRSRSFPARPRSSQNRSS